MAYDPTQEEAEEERELESWMTRRWRPMMAIMYMICCLCDFAIFPVMYTLVQYWGVDKLHDAAKQLTLVQWSPITLQGGGLFHVAMGAVLGITAFGRTQEKVATINSQTTPTQS